MAAVNAPLTPSVYEPKKQYLWVVEFDGLDAFVARTTKRPTIGFEEIEIPYLNTKRYLAGKFEFETIEVTFHDPLDGSEADKVMDWIKLIGNPENVNKNFAATYKKDFKIKLLDGNGVVVEQWQIVGAWPQSSNFGDLDYSSNDPVEITVTFRYDRAFML